MLIKPVTNAMATYENDRRPKGCAFVIAMPGAGAELLLKLLATSALTHVVGTQEPSFYHALTVLGESVSVNANTYGKVGLIGNPDMDYRFHSGESQEQDTRMTHYYIRNILLKSAGYCIAFTDLLRDEGQGWISRFAQVLRDINDTSTNNPLKVVFLTADAEDTPYDTSAEYLDMLQEFREASELGDIWITKKELLADPKATMMKIKCSHYPQDFLIERVMNKYV